MREVLNVIERRGLRRLAVEMLGLLACAALAYGGVLAGAVVS